MFLILINWIASLLSKSIPFNFWNSSVSAAGHVCVCVCVCVDIRWVSGWCDVLDGTTAFHSSTVHR